MAIINRLRTLFDSTEAGSQSGDTLIVPAPGNVGGTAGGITHGGMVNPLSGQGGFADKGDSAYFVPTLFRTRYALEVLYVESWAAGKFIDIPVDDMFINGRRWIGDDEAASDRMDEVCREFRVYEKLAMALKAGCLYGTGMLVIMSLDAAPDEPLIIDRIRPGDLSNLVVFDRFDAAVAMRVSNPYDPRYGEPEMYKFTPQSMAGLELMVHASRVLRFDGKKPVSAAGWGGYYDREWGVSTLIPAINEIVRDATFSGAISQLSQEASIPVVKIDGYKDMLAATASNLPSVDDPDPAVYGESMNLYKSIYRTMFLDRNDEFIRVDVNFSGLGELLEKMAMRLAAIADIPATRFLARSPGGMNATGESDARNYSIRVAAMQKSKLAEPLMKLDLILARHIGLAAVPEYEWLPLSDLSEREKAEISKLKAETLATYYNIAALDENEVREVAGKDETIGMLEPMPESELGKNLPPMPGDGDGSQA